LRLFSFGGYGLALAALALVVFGAIECPHVKQDLSPCMTTGSCFRILKAITNHSRFVSEKKKTGQRRLPFKRISKQRTARLSFDIPLTAC